MGCYVLAGGRSRRLGQDKARAMIGEKTTVLEAVLRPLDGVFSSFTVVAESAGKFDDLGLRTIADDRPGLGPLGGILRAVKDASQGYFFVVSCDRIGLQARWVERLSSRLSSRPPAICFCSGGQIEPLFGFYHTDIRAQLKSCLNHQTRAVWRFLDEIDASTIEAPPGWNQTFSVNTPKQLIRARRWFKDPDLQGP